MLVQHWLQRLQREGWFGTRRVYAWSFYSQGTKEDRQASEDTFLAHALEWFGVQCEPTLSPWDKGCLLADAIGRERTLLILDGIEPLQYPPGPMGGQLRAPGVQSLLKRLARKASDAEHGGLCLVTTREPLTDLADFQRRPDAAWGSVLRVDLGNLIEEAGAALLHQAGTKRAGAAEIKADDTELLAASREVDGHALTLNLLGRFLARAHGGDIRRRDLVKFGEADRKEQGGTTFKMLAAFENWFATEGDIEARSLAVLRMLGVFDRPADAGCLGALRRPPVITGLTESLFVLKRDSSNGQVSEQPLSDKAWNDVTHFLSDFGLITIQADADENEFLLDCHPLVREHFAKRFQNNFSEAWRSSHLRLYDHLTKTTKESSHPTLGALQPLYQAVSHGCLAGMHQDACVKVYQRRILKGDENYSSFKLGATSLDLQAIRCFFDIPWAHLSPNLDAYEEGWLLNETGCALHSLGRLNEARDAALAALKFNEDRGETGAAGIVLALLTAIEADLGNVSSALRAAECSVEFSSLNIIPLDRVGGHRTYADVLFQWGDFKKALTEFEVAEGLREESKRKFPFLNLSLCIPFEHSELLLHNSEGLAWLKQTDTSASVGERLKNDVISSCSHVGLRTSTDTENQEQPILHGGLSHLTLGRLSLYQLVLLPSDPKSGEFLSYARKNLEQALAALHRSANATHIPRGFLSRAWLRFVESDSDGARADLDEAWDIAERGPMRLHMADIHLHRARLFFRQKPYPWKSPQADLAAAEKLINDCGYHRRDQELADAKSAILGQS
jgi:tetratricopeptide (TPR) repeat protein